jgi:hypothetical protein
MVMDLGKLVLQYSAMHAMASQISEEIVEFLSRMADQSQRRIQQGQWALTADDERLRLAECRRWRKSVDDLHAKIGSIRSGFCAGVKRFTQALDKDGDMKLKHLSNRLQFNEWC